MFILRQNINWINSKMVKVAPAQAIPTSEAIIIGWGLDSGGGYGDSDLTSNPNKLTLKGGAQKVVQIVIPYSSQLSSSFAVRLILNNASVIGSVPVASGTSGTVNYSAPPMNFNTGDFIDVRATSGNGSFPYSVAIGSYLLVQ